MTDPVVDDSRVIDTFADVYNSTLVHRVDHTSDLAYFWVKLDGPATPFEPGQYMTTGVFADGKLWQRPYSVASAPSVAGTEGYEFFVRLVPILRFTTALWRLEHRAPDADDRPQGQVHARAGRQPDAPVRVDGHRHRPVHLDDPRDAWPRGSRGKTVLLHGCSFAAGAGLPRRSSRSGSATRRIRLTLRPDDLAPRRSAQRGLDRHAPAASEQVVADVCRDLGLRPDRTVVYICGNPEMILNVERVLMDRGFPEFHVKKELYWPKGKAPAAPAAG